MKNDALFVRLDSFRDRCRDALDFTRTVIQFSKLERVEIGGTKGKANGKEWEGMGWCGGKHGTRPFICNLHTCIA